MHSNRQSTLNTMRTYITQETDQQSKTKSNWARKKIRGQNVRIDNDIEEVIHRSSQIHQASYTVQKVITMKDYERKMHDKSVNRK